MRYAISRYSEAGDWVADPFAGSGTVCVEAVLTGRGCVAVDINPLTGFLVRLKTLKLPPGVGDVVGAVRDAVREALAYRGEGFAPAWGRALYWYRADVLEELSRLWGYVRSAPAEWLRLILSAALLRVSRRFSYADDQIPKLYRSRLKAAWLARVLAGDWRALMAREFERWAVRVAEGVAELNDLMRGRRWPEVVVMAGVDAARAEPPVRPGLVVTSPPYLIAHEYFRSTKLELYWLGHSEEEVRALARHEIPYNRPPPLRVRSETYGEYRDIVGARNPRLLRYYDAYFRTVLAALERHAPRPGGVLAVFIGPATLAGAAIPVHRIIREHLEARGYEHVQTLADTIKARKIFRRRKNPNPDGIQKEYLLIMRAP